MDLNKYIGAKVLWKSEYKDIIGIVIDYNINNRCYEVAYFNFIAQDEGHCYWVAYFCNILREIDAYNEKYTSTLEDII